ncbi:MAG: hypothetical protein JWN15_458 [Firmicutes bacterium]|nr:hypothetical protein [Bacillota bacterium]
MPLPLFNVDGERARAFVLAHAGSRDQARLAGIFAGARPEREVVKALEALQNPDGGFPLVQQPGNPSSIDTTCYMLSVLKDMPPLAGSPMASRAVAFLRRNQQPDGSWRESPEVATMSPFWTAQSDPKATAYVTANATYTIFTLAPEHMDPIGRAVRWLREAVNADDAYTQTLALAWAVLYRLDGPNRELFAQLEQRNLDAPALGWWLTCALEVGAGGPFLLPLAQQLDKLALRQRADGAWPAEEGFETESTLTALRVFRGYGVL